MDELLFLRFIANILNIRTDRIHPGDSNQILKAFEPDCCFHATLQPMYTTKSLEYLMTNVQPETFYEITDYLNTSLLLFQFKGTYYLIGPYTKSILSDEELQTLLASHRLPASVFLSLKLYYSKFPQLSYGMVSGTIQAAMRTFYPTTPDYTCRKLTGFHEELQKDEIIFQSSQTYLQVVKRYEMENFLLRKIAEGDVKGVELSFQNVSTNFYANENPSLQSVYVSNNIGFTTIRALARKAAEQGGCPVVQIDEITQASIQKASYTRNTGELNLIIKDLLIRLTTAVAEAKNLRKYPPVIRDVLSYLNQNYTEPIFLQKLADDHHISAEYLSRTFKKEIGQNITDYISGLRTEKAASLLRNSKLSIAEIAAFVGYSDSNYFVKVFKKHYGMTPSAYR